MPISQRRKASALALFLVVSAPGAAKAEVNEFQIRPGPIDSALSEFGAVSGIELIYDSSLTSGLTSKGVSGFLDAEAALETLLEESGLSYVIEEQTARLYHDVVSQNSVDEETFDLGTIKVTGELIERDVQKSRTSAVVIQGEDIETGIVTDFGQITEKIPGVTVSDRFADEFSIRGIAERPSGGNARTVNVQVDGASFGVPGRVGSTDFSTFDLEQVEILRGPQSTQTGRNALAGAVIVRSRDPEYVQETRVRLAYGSLDTAQAAIAFNTPLIDDTLALRFTLDRMLTDGEISNPTLGIDNYDSAQKTTARLGLRWDPTDQFSAVLKYTYYDNTTGFGQVLRDELPNRIIDYDVRERDDVQFNSVNLQFSYDFNNSVRLESSTSFSHADIDFLTDLDMSSAPVGALFIDETSEVFEQELKLRYQTGTTYAVVGLYYYNETRRQSNTTPAFSGAENIINFDTENYAIFGEIEHEFTPQWSVIAGARYDVEEGGTFSQVLMPPGTETNFSFEAFLPKLGVVYSFRQNTSLGLTYQRGYRAGGQRFNIFTAEGISFDPEFTNNYELSFRSEFYEGSLIVNANAFYTEWTDQQVTVAGPSGNPQDVFTANAGESELFGFELDVRGQPSNQLSLYGGVAYVHTEYKDFLLTPTTQLAGNAFPFAPEWTASVGGQYDFDNDWFISGSISYTDGAFGDPGNNAAFRTDARTLVDLQVGLRRDRWTAYVFATNLFDEEYVTFNGNARSNLANPGDGRRIGVVFESTF
ncbi:MAG: TonB-dependent receptor [Pseudomonadota bacterium]